MKKLNCVLCATPDIASEVLLRLNAHPMINLSLVVSMPDRPAGRGKKLKSPEVIEKAKEYDIPFIQTANINKSDEFLEWSQKNSIDFMVVFAFAQFLGSKILNLPQLGCFNIHTSLLPKYRGAAPMQYALFNGDDITGITIQKMVKKMDAGDVVLSREMKIEDEDNFGTLHDKFKIVAAELINNFVDSLLEGKITGTPQDESLVSFAPSIPKSETNLDFKNNDSITLHNKIRGLSPIPSAYCFLNNKRLKVFKSELSEIKLQPQEVNTSFNTLLVGSSSGTIRLKEVQLEGKSKCKDHELINGFKNSGQEINISSQKENT